MSITAFQEQIRTMTNMPQLVKFGFVLTTIYLLAPVLIPVTQVTIPIMENSMYRFQLIQKIEKGKVVIILGIVIIHTMQD